MEGKTCILACLSTLDVRALSPFGLAFTTQAPCCTSELPQYLRFVHAKPLRAIGSLTNELEAYTSAT